jgi:hypothetical protein
LNSALRLAISCGFWFFTRTMETSMYLVQSLWIEFSNHGLSVERPVTKPPESTWMDWGFLPSAFRCYISSSTIFFEARWALHMLLVWKLMGEVICAPLLTPKLGLDNVVKRRPICTVRTRCLPSHGTLGMPWRGPMFWDVVGTNDQPYSLESVSLGGGLMAGNFIWWPWFNCYYFLAFCAFPCTHSQQHHL